MKKGEIKYKENELIKIIEDYNNNEFICTSIIENKGLKSRVTIKHKICQREFPVILYNLVYLNRGCKFCNSNRMDKEKIKNLINKEKDYKCISCGNKTTNNAEILHKICNKKFTTKAGYFLYNNSRCPFCFKPQKYTIDLIKEKINNNFPDYEFLKLSNTGLKPSREKMSIRHKICNKTSDIIVHNFFNNGQRCKECSKKKLKFSGNSKSTKIIDDFLNNNKILFEKEKTFDNLIYKKRLRIDYYFEFNKRKIAIEYDGKQHFKTNKTNKIFTTEKLKIQQKRDEIKNKYCKQNNIELYRLKYRLTENEIKEVLQSIINSEVSE